jgi:hypothetical protein
MGASADPFCRGEGIFVTGGLRIRNLQLAFNAATGEPLPPRPLTVEVRTDAWHHWLKACDEARDDCHRAREGSRGASEDDFRTQIEQEFRRGMQAVGAAAFALDAFYASVVEHAPEARIVVSSRAKSVTATLLNAFTVTNPQGKYIRVMLRDIFRFRDAAVHPPARFVAPVRHPTFGLNVDPRFVMFGLENVVKIRDGVHQLLWLLLHRPRPRYPALVEWAAAGESLIADPEQA